MTMHGLVCGYCVDHDGTLRVVEPDGLDQVLADETTIVWLHFDQADPDARSWIEANERLPPAAKAVLLGSDGHMRIEPTGHGLAGVVGDLHHEFVQRSDHLDVLRLYLDNRCLISARREPLTAIDKLRHSIAESLAMVRPIRLIAQFLHHVTDTLGDIMLDLSDTLDDLEEAAINGRAEAAPEALNRVRRVAARLRRHMVPQQHALLGLLTRLPDWVETDEAAQLRSAIERLSALGHDLDLVQERARLLQEQRAARLMESTNRNLYILSIATVVALPPTVISGVFGMNLGGLPAQQDHLGFYYGLAFMSVTVLATMLLLKRVKML